VLGRLSLDKNRASSSSSSAYSAASIVRMTCEDLPGTSLGVRIPHRPSVHVVALVVCQAHWAPGCKRSTQRKRCKKYSSGQGDEPSPKATHMPSL
jgi:hypothetical protein